MSRERPKKVTIRDVAKIANVSRATVTRALDDFRNSSIKPATRERVKAVAAQLNYRPSTMLRLAKSRAVCIPFMGTERTPMGVGKVTLALGDTVAGANSVLRPIGYRVEPLFFEEKDEADLVLHEMFVAGYFDAVLMPHAELNEVGESLAREGCIVVTTAPTPTGLANHYTVPYLPVEFFAVFEEIVRQGRRKILITFPAPERFLDVYSAEIASGKLEYADRGPGRETANDAEGVVEIALSGRFDTIVTRDEFFGWEIFKLLHQRGMDVPGEITIAGAADVRHVFKPLPILNLLYARKSLQMRELACRLIEVLAAETPSERFVVPPPCSDYTPRLRLLSPAEFTTAARAELRREYLQAEVEGEILRGRGRENGAH